MANFAAYFQFGDVYVELNNGIVAEDYSSCPDENNVAYLTIEFDCGGLAFGFGLNPNKTIQVDTIAGTTINYQFENNVVGQEQGMRTQHPDHAYRCDSEQTISTQLVISKIVFEVFRDEKEPDFYQPEEHCSSDSIMKYD